MNERIRELMQSAGYAAPELASRAQKLTELILADVLEELEPRHDSRTEVFRTHKDLHNRISKRYGINDATTCEHVWKENAHVAQHSLICSRCWTITQSA